MPKKGSKAEPRTNEPVINLLVNNFASLQKSFAVLTEKFDVLSNEISSLLKLFEISAKSIAQKPEFGFEKEFIGKLNALLEQNKVIAKAMAIIEERTRAGPQLAPQPPMQYAPPAMPSMPAMPARRIPQPMPQARQMPSQPAGMAPVPEEYTASSFTPERKPKPLPQV